MQHLNTFFLAPIHDTHRVREFEPAATRTTTTQRSIEQTRPAEQIDTHNNTTLQDVLEGDEREAQQLLRRDLFGNLVEAAPRHWPPARLNRVQRARRLQRRLVRLAPSIIHHPSSFISRELLNSDRFGHHFSFAFYFLTLFRFSFLLVGQGAR